MFGALSNEGRWCNPTRASPGATAWRVGQSSLNTTSLHRGFSLCKRARISNFDSMTLSFPLTTGPFIIRSLAGRDGDNGWRKERRVLPNSTHATQYSCNYSTHTLRAKSVNLRKDITSLHLKLSSGMDLLDWAYCMNLTIVLNELNGWIFLQRAHMLWAQSCRKASDALVQGCNLAACILHAVLDAPPLLGRHALSVEHDVAVHR